MSYLACPSLNYADAVHVLARGGVIAYPTESVWGLGCDPRQPEAVHRLFRLKKRSVQKGLILLVRHIDELSDWLDHSTITPAMWQCIHDSWPGPHTWTFPARTDAPTWICGKHHTIAVRISDHPTVGALCNAWQAPLVSTSANRSGQPAVSKREDLDLTVFSLIDGIVEGQTGQLAQPTSIRDARTGLFIRV